MIISAYTGDTYEKYQGLVHRRIYLYISIRNVITLFLRLVREKSADRSDKSCQLIHMGTYETCIFSCAYLVVFHSFSHKRIIARLQSCVSSWRTLGNSVGSGSVLYVLRHTREKYRLGGYCHIFYQCLSGIPLHMDFTEF